MRITLRQLENTRGSRVVGHVVPCPVCERRSVYVRAHDRYVHLDGSANVHCRVHLSRGEPLPRARIGTAAGDAAQAA
jgi:hypothetical protein